MVGSTQAVKVLRAHNPRGTSVQHSFHYLPFEQPDLERQPGVPSFVQLGTVFSDTRPSGADATLNLGVKVRALADTTTKVHKLGCLFISLSCRFNSQGVRRCAGMGPQGNGLGPFLRHFFLFLFYFISLIADGPHHYHPACGHKGSSHLSPVHALQFFYRDASSALLQFVNQWLNFTYSRSHAFRYERKNTKSYFGKNRTHDFRTSRCAAYLLDHSGDDCQYEFLICDNYNVHHPGKPTRRCRHRPRIVCIHHPPHDSPNHFQRPLLPGPVILTLRRIIEVHQVRNDQRILREPLQNHYDDRRKEGIEQ